MIDSSNLYDGLETLWLGSADESLAAPQVRLRHLLAAVRLDQSASRRFLSNDG